MAWGEGGQELREQVQKELALTRVPLYRMRTAVGQIKHPEKGPQLKMFVDEVYEILEKIEAVLRR